MSALELLLVITVWVLVALVFATIFTAVWVYRITNR